MSKPYSVTDVAFEGFRLVRENPGMALVWAVLMLVMSSAAYVGMAYSGLGEIMTQLQSGGGTPEGLLDAYAGAAPILTGMIIVSILLGVMFMASVFRVTLNGSKGAGAKLSFGSDELRLIGIYLLFFLFFVLIIFGGAFLLGVAAGALGASGQTGAATLVGVLAVVFLTAFSIWFSVKLSLAGPMSIAEGKLVFFKSMSLSKGHFWSLLGTYLLVFILTVIVSILGSLILAVIALGVTGGSLEQVGTLFNTFPTAVEDLYDPARLVYIVGTALINTLTAAMFYGAQAEAYRVLSNRGAEQVF